MEALPGDVPVPLDQRGGEIGRTEHPRLTAVKGLLNIDEQKSFRASGLLDLMGDPARREIVKRLAEQPGRRLSVLQTLGAATPDEVKYKLRTLERAGAVVRNDERVYRVDPAAAKAASAYFDLLATVASASESEFTDVDRPGA